MILVTKKYIFVTVDDENLFIKCGERFFHDVMEDIAAELFGSCLVDLINDKDKIVYADDEAQYNLKELAYDYMN